MPCYDYGSSAGRSCDGSCNQSELKRERDQRKKLEAMLCGLASVVQLNALFNQVDWKETGVSREEFDNWHRNHKEEDRQRKLQEQQKKTRDSDRAHALKKLSDREKKLLGLK